MFKFLLLIKRNCIHFGAHEYYHCLWTESSQTEENPRGSEENKKRTPKNPNKQKTTRTIFYTASIFVSFGIIKKSRKDSYLSTIFETEKDFSFYSKLRNLLLISRYEFKLKLYNTRTMKSQKEKPISLQDPFVWKFSQWCLHNQTWTQAMDAIYIKTKKSYPNVIFNL